MVFGRFRIGCGVTPKKSLTTHKGGIMTKKQVVLNALLKKQDNYFTKEEYARNLAGTLGLFVSEVKDVYIHEETNSQTGNPERIIVEALVVTDESYGTVIAKVYGVWDVQDRMWSNTFKELI